MLFDRIKSSTHVGLFTHVNPDGDAAGSTLALAAFLDSLGKGWTVFYPSCIPDSLEFMKEGYDGGKLVVWDSSHAERCNALVSSCDLLIGLDFNDIDRIKEWGEPFILSKAPKILIDHHVNPQAELFDEVYSRTDVSSTCELLFILLKQCPPLSGDVSSMPELTRRSLMTGMTTDTNNFANSVYPQTLEMASELLAAGTDRDSIIQNLYFRYPKRRLDAEGYLICNKLKVTREGIAYIIMDKCVMNRFHLKEGETEGFVNKALSIDGVNVSLLLKEERSSPIVRVSIRSKAGWSAREMAVKYFHGGGHELASGGRLTIGEDIKCMGEAEKYVKRCIKEFAAR